MDEFGDFLKFLNTPKHEKLIRRPSDLGNDINISKTLVVFCTRVSNANNWMEETQMSDYIDLFGDIKTETYLNQLSYQEMRGFITRLNNVLIKKNHYQWSVGAIITDWVLRLGPAFYQKYRVDIFKETDIVNHLQEIWELKSLVEEAVAVWQRYLYQTRPS